MGWCSVVCDPGDLALFIALFFCEVNGKRIVDFQDEQKIFSVPSHLLIFPAHSRQIFSFFFLNEKLIINFPFDFNEHNYLHRIDCTYSLSKYLYI